MHDFITDFQYQLENEDEENMNQLENEENKLQELSKEIDLTDNIISELKREIENIKNEKYINSNAIKQMKETMVQSEIANTNLLKERYRPPQKHQ